MALNNSVLGVPALQAVRESLAVVLTDLGTQLKMQGVLFVIENIFVAPAGGLPPGWNMRAST